MPFLLYTYLTAEIIGPFLAAFFIVNFVLFFGQVVPLLDVILNLDISFANFLRMSAYLWPKILFFSLPMAGLIGIVLAFSRLTNDGEIRALKASGLPFRHFVIPVALFALMLSAFSAYTGLNLSPAGKTNLKKLMFYLAREKFDRGLKEKFFSEGTGNFVLYVEHINPDTNEWEGVFLSDLGDASHPVTILARRGRFTADSENLKIQLLLENGSIHRSQDKTTQTIFFKRYHLSIPVSLPPAVMGGTPGQISSGELSLSQLQQLAHESGIQTKKGKSLLIEFHSRLASPVGCLLLSLLGLPLGLMAGPGKRAIGLPLGILLFLSYFTLLIAGKAVAESSDALPIGMAIWMANTVYFALVAAMLYLARNEMLGRLSGWLENIFFWLRTILTGKRQGQKAGL